MATFNATLYSVSDITHDKEELKMLNKSRVSKRFAKRSGIIPYIKKCILNSGKWVKVKLIADPEVSIDKDGNLIIKVSPNKDTNKASLFNAVIVTCKEDDDEYHHITFVSLFDDIKICKEVNNITITVNSNALPDPI